jgi:hypothetical protein
MTTFASASVWKISPFSSSSRSFALKLSQQPFSHGLPGSIYAAVAPTAAIHFLTAFATNSGPLSDLM